MDRRRRPHFISNRNLLVANKDGKRIRVCDKYEMKNLAKQITTEHAITANNYDIELKYIPPFDYCKIFIQQVLHESVSRFVDDVNMLISYLILLILFSIHENLASFHVKFR